MKTDKLNKWEEMFIDFLDMTGFYLRKRVDENNVVCYGLEDGQRANLANIESEYFYSATDILERMEVYEYDYIIADLEECAASEDLELEYSQWTDLLKYRTLMPNNQYSFNLIEMICHHSVNIDVNKVYNHLAS